MGKKYNDKRNANQIYKKDGNNCFLEVLGPTPSFQKITFRIIKYNKQRQEGNKIEKQFSFYLDLPNMLGLCRYVDNGSIRRLNEAIKAKIIKKEEDQKNGIKNEEKIPFAVWWKQGGTPSRNGKPTESRILSLIPATRSKYANIMFKIQVGEGKEDKRGLIQPVGYQDMLSVGLEYDDLYNMCEYIKVRIQAFCSWMQMAGYYDPAQAPDQPDQNAEVNQNNNHSPAPVKETPEERENYSSNSYYEDYNTLFYNVG